MAHHRQVLPLERLVAGEHLVEDDAEREEVRPVVDLLALDLLRRHVVRRAEELPLLGEVRAVEPGDAEVGDLHPPFLGDQDVRRLDVAVHHPVGVGVVEGVPHLGDDVEHAGQRQRLLPLEHQLQVGAAHVLHGDEGEPLVGGLDHVMDGDDVGMGQDARALRLPHEADAELLHLLVLDRVADTERLQGHQPADQRVAGQVDDAHRPLADLVDDLVAAKLGRGQGEHGVMVMEPNFRSRHSRPPGALESNRARDG